MAPLSGFWGQERGVNTNIDMDKTLSVLLDEMQTRYDEAKTDFEKRLYKRFIEIIEEYIPTL